jgi:hypothetical protein
MRLEVGIGVVDVWELCIGSETLHKIAISDGNVFLKRRIHNNWPINLDSIGDTLRHFSI